MLLDMWETHQRLDLGRVSEWYDQGVGLLTRWTETRNLPWQVLCREVKETFDLTVPGHEDEEPQKITYIMDRLDRRPDGSIEIIDYKSQWANVTPDTLARMVQPALYAAAVRRKYGEAPVIVTFDMLRYGMVSTVFTDTQIDRSSGGSGGPPRRSTPTTTLSRRSTRSAGSAPARPSATPNAATDLHFTPTLGTDELVATGRQRQQPQGPGEPHQRDRRRPPRPDRRQRR